MQQGTHFSLCSVLLPLLPLLLPVAAGCCFVAASLVQGGRKGSRVTDPFLSFKPLLSNCHVDSA